MTDRSSWPIATLAWLMKVHDLYSCIVDPMNSFKCSLNFSLPSLMGNSTRNASTHHKKIQQQSLTESCICVGTRHIKLGIIKQYNDKLISLVVDYKPFPLFSNVNLSAKKLLSVLSQSLLKCVCCYSESAQLINSHRQGICKLCVKLLWAASKLLRANLFIKLVVVNEIVIKQNLKCRKKLLYWRQEVLRSRRKLSCWFSPQLHKVINASPRSSWRKSHPFPLLFTSLVIVCHS